MSEGTCVGESGDQEDASIGVDAAGDALVAWTREVGEERHVILCSLQAGVWQSDDVGLGFDPVVGLDDDGAGIVVWTQDDGAALLAARYQGGQLDTPVAVSDTLAHRALAVHPSGSAVVLVSQLELVAYHYDPQADTWDTTARALPVSADRIIESPRVEATSAGFMAAWIEIDLVTGERQIRAARFADEATGWTTSEEFANVGAAPAGGGAALALDTSGPGHALITFDISDPRTVGASAYPAQGTWVRQLLYDDTDQPEPVFPTGGVDASGRGWVVWASQPPVSDYEIFVARFAGGWFTTELLQTTFMVSSMTVNVADSGRALLLWLGAGVGSMALHAAQAEANGAFGPGAVVVDDFLVDGGSLRAATGPNGHTVAAWRTIPGGMVATALEW